MGTIFCSARKFTVSRTAIFIASFKSSSNPMKTQAVEVSTRGHSRCRSFLTIGSISISLYEHSSAVRFTSPFPCKQCECSYKEIEIEPIVRKDLHLEWPRVETSTDWVFMGFDEDLNEAMKIAVRETVNFLAEQKMVPMSREEAYALTSIVGDCRVSQVVDIRKGVHCMIPKSIFVKK